MITLIVNNNLVTPSQGETIALQKSAAKIGELKSRQGSYTNDFNIPATDENVAALGYSSMIDIIGDVATHTKRVSATLFDSSIEVARGFVQIVSANYLDRKIKLSFFGGLSDWVSRMSGKSIRDLDLSAYNHIWNLSNIQASWTASEGYIYPLIDYGDLDGFGPTDAFYTEDFYPALYQKTILAQAFSEIGYKVSGSFINEFPYQRAIIPFVEKEFLSSPEFSETFAGSMRGQQLYQQTFSTVPVDFEQKMSYTTKVDNEYGNFSTFANQFTAEKNETYRMRLEVDIANFEITNTGGNGADTSTLSIFAANTAGDVALPNQEIVSLTGTGTASASGVFIFEFDWLATAGDKLETLINFESDSTTATSVQYIAQFNSYQLFCDGIDRVMAPGDLVEMAYVMPDLQITEMVRDMIQRHGLVVTTDDYTQTVKFDRFELLPNQDAVDWSDRISISGVHALDFTSVTEGYSKVNLFEYASPSDDDELLTEYNDENTVPLGQGQIEISNEWLSEEGTIYTSIYKATEMHSPFSGNMGLYVPHIRRYGYGQSLEFSPGARVLYVVPNASVQDITLAGYSQINISGTFVTNIAYCYFYKKQTGSELDNLTDMLSYGEVAGANVVGESLVSQNYRAINRILNRGKLVEVSVQLREHEYVSLDFFQPVFIDAGEIRGYFFVDEVMDYEGGNKLCRVRLIGL